MRGFPLGPVILLFLPLGKPENLDEFKTTAEVSNSVARQYGTACTIIITPSFITSDENERIRRLLKALQRYGKIFKTVGVQEIRNYAGPVPNRYDIHPCSKPLHIMYGAEDRIPDEFIQVTHSAKITGPIWIAFISNSTPVELYFSDVYIPFDAIFIAAVREERTVSLTQVHRVTMNHGLRTTAFGVWSEGSGLSVSADAYPYRKRKDLEGKTFRVAAKEVWPMTTVTVNADNVTVGVGGYLGDLWNDLQNRLNFTTVFVEPDENSLGMWNGTEWNGLIGSILRDEIDAAISGISVTSGKMAAIDFLRPLFSTRYQLFFKTTGYLIEWDVIFRPFTTQVWLIFLFWFVVVTLFLAISHYIGLKFDLENRETASAYDGYHCIFAVLAAFMQQGNSQVPKSLSCRLIIFVAHIFSTIAVILYSSILMSMIAVQKDSVPFNSLESFIQDGTYSIELISGSDGFTYFSNSSWPVLQEIYRRFFSKLPDEELPKTQAEALERVCEGNKIAHLGELEVTNTLAKAMAQRTGCSIMYMDTPLAPMYLSIGIAKNNPYKKAFDHELIRMASAGFIRCFQYRNMAPLKDVTRISSFRPVHGRQIVQIYVVFLMGVMLSVLIVYLELLFMKHRVGGGKAKGKQNAEGKEGDGCRMNQQMPFVRHRTGASGEAHSRRR